jgi:hypothetical protein
VRDRPACRSQTPAPGSGHPARTNQSMPHRRSAPGARTTRNRAPAQYQKAAAASGLIGPISGGSITPKSGGPIPTKSGGSFHTKSCSNVAMRSTAPENEGFNSCRPLCLSTARTGHSKSLALSAAHPHPSNSAV